MVITIVLMGMVLRIIVLLHIIVMVHIDAYCYYHCADGYDIVYYFCSADYCHGAYVCILILLSSDAYDTAYYCCFADYRHDAY